MGPNPDLRSLGEVNDFVRDAVAGVCLHTPKQCVSSRGSIPLSILGRMPCSVEATLTCVDSSCVIWTFGRSSLRFGVVTLRSSAQDEHSLFSDLAVLVAPHFDCLPFVLC